MRAAIPAAAALLPLERDPQAVERWQAVVNRSFSVVWPQTAVALPPELEASQKSLREIGPGLWSDHLADGTVRGYVWQATLHNGSALALPLAEFRLLPPARNPASIVFNCALPRYAESMLAAAGEDTRYLCRASTTVGPAHPAYAQLLRQFTGQAPVDLRIEPRDLLTSASAEALLGRLEKLARPMTDALLAQHADCRSRGDCAPAPALAATKSPLAVLDDPRWTRIWTNLHIAGTALGMLLAYAFGVRLIGRGGASVVAVVLGWISAAQWVMNLANGQPLFTRGTDAGAMAALVAPVYVIGVAAIAPVLAVSAISFVYELVFGDRAATLRDMGRAFIKAMAEGLVDVLLGRRRRR